MFERDQSALKSYYFFPTGELRANIRYKIAENKATTIYYFRTSFDNSIIRLGEVERVIGLVAINWYIPRETY